MIQIDYLIMSHVFEFVSLTILLILGMKSHLIKDTFLKNTRNFIDQMPSHTPNQVKYFILLIQIHGS